MSAAYLATDNTQKSGKLVQSWSCRPLVLCLITPLLLLSACSKTDEAPETASTEAIETQPVPSEEEANIAKAIEAYNDQNFGFAQSLIRPFAEDGDAGAQYLLGDMLLHGKGSAVNVPEAVEWFEKSAESGNDQALYQMAMLYSDGLGVPNDEAEALRFMKAAVEKNYAPAQYMYGLYELRNDHKPEAISLLTQAAENGDAQAQHLLGEFYARGENVPKDITKAASLLTQSAAQNNAEAMATLAFLYQHGLGVPKDLTKAEILLMAAAQQKNTHAIERLTSMAESGLPEAQLDLGLLYRDGVAVEQDDTVAKEWTLKAAEQGYAPAQFQVAQAFGSGRGGEQDYVQAHKWMNLAAANGYEGAADRRDVFAKLMTAEQIAEAQKLAREWQPIIPSSTEASEE